MLAPDHRSAFTPACLIEPGSEKRTTTQATCLEADGDAQQAWLLNEQSLTLTRQLGDRRMEGNVLTGLARAARARGAPAAARGLLGAAAAAYVAVGDLGVLTNALNTRAALLADIGELEHAVRLAALAARLAVQVGSHGWPSIRRERDAWLAPARQALGDEWFSRVWAEGETMTVEAAVAHHLAAADA